MRLTLSLGSRVDFHWEPRRKHQLGLGKDSPNVLERHRVKRADGPERVFGEWWRRPNELEAVRDYFAIENDDGERFWIFRSGDGVDQETGSHKWFMHGIFA